MESVDPGFVSPAEGPGFRNATDREAVEVALPVGLVMWSHLNGRFSNSCPRVRSAVDGLETRSDHFFDSYLIENHAHA